MGFRPLLLMLAATSLTLSSQALAGFAGNGIYDSVPYESYLNLTAAQHELYKAQLGRLSDANFVHNPDNGYETPSFYRNIEGRSELDEISSEILERRGQYSRIVQIGRSFTGINAYLQARISIAHPTGELGEFAEFTDLPFSNQDPALQITPAQRLGLRNHLAANGLSPMEITTSVKPILFLNFVFNGTAPIMLLEEIQLWAKEQNLEEEVKKNTHFLGLYPAKWLARAELEKVYLQNNTSPDRKLPEYSDETLDIAAKTTTLPLKDVFLRYASKIHEIKVSTEFYLYAAVNAPFPQKSFPHELWDKPIDRNQKLTLVGHEMDPAYIEIYYLMWSGQMDGRAELGSSEIAIVSCEKSVLTHQY